MKEKLRNFVVAARIISDLPSGEVKNKAIVELFEKSLPDLKLPDGSFDYRKIDLGSGCAYQFACKCEAEDWFVVMNTIIGDEKEFFLINSNLL